MDDILVATNSVERHLELLKEILRVLSENKVKLQMTKCQWVKREIDFLGYRVSEKGISPNDEHVKTVKEYPTPMDVKGVQRFIGLVSYFRKFIRDFKDLAAPFQTIVRSKVYKWGTEEEKCFKGLCATLVGKPILKIFNPKLETELHTDASANGFGAILLQRDEEDGKMYPVSFYSKKSSNSEQKLHSFELETLAVVYSLQRFRPYLMGMKFKLVTDCSAMKMTLAKRDMCPKIERWALMLAEYDYETEHRPGERMQHVDALSRIYVLGVDEEDLQEEEDEEEEVEEQDKGKIKLIIAQTKDKVVQELKRQIENGEKKGYEVREGIVYRKEGTRLQLVVPEKMINSVLYRMHDSMGHMGEKKTCANITRFFS